jgi:hypothetical protein
MEISSSSISIMPQEVEMEPGRKAAWQVTAWRLLERKPYKSDICSDSDMIAAVAFFD